ncbi:MAG TPA: ATP-dependent DNA helicase RecQ, partial [Blastocatellia bacterium]|nr:ATP-dependent DNA helicase RecQ [Blastocatellia bacterium]
MNASVVAQGYLSRYFGFRGLREGQGEIINSVLEGRDTLAVMPTGGGKSLCYQLPATMSEGVTLVISPLIALMKDQVDALTARGVPTTLINSSLGFREIKERLAATSEGRFKLIYISPERLRSDAIIQAIRAANIKLLAVDEAHCISHWGHDFRPDYLKIGVASELLGRPQTIALTATATPRVRQDIIDQLRLRDPNVFVAGFDRPNLRLTVRHSGGEKDKLQAVKQILESVPGSGVIYAATRKAVEQLAARLKMSGYDAVPYHGAMPPDERTRVQERFMSGDIRAIVATNAFGMGIDKPDIRFVIHYHIPGSIEAYYQEIGRAGRDGADAGCFLLFNYADTRTQQFFIDAGQPSIDLVTQVYRAIAAIQAEQQNQGDHTVSPEAIASKIGVKPAAIGPALGVLERAGHVERGRRADSTTLVSLLMPVDLALEAVAENSAEGRLLEYLIFETGVSGGEAVEINPGEVALSLGLSQTSTQNRMALLAARGLISCRSAFVGQGVRLLDPEPVATL